MPSMGKAVVALTTLLAASAVFLGYSQWQAMPVMFICHAVGMLSAWALMIIGSSVYKGAKTRPQVRMLHGVVQTIAFIAACIGYYGIYKNHEVMGVGQFGFWPLNNARAVHVLVGYVVLTGMVVQVCQGWARKFQMDKGVFTKYLTHPYQGRVVQVGAACNILLAAYFMGLSTITIAMSCMVVLATLGGMLPVKAVKAADLKQNLIGYSEASETPVAVVGA